MSKPKPKRKHAILPLTLQPEELQELRQTLPDQRRSAILRELLIREGYLSPKSA